MFHTELDEIAPSRPLSDEVTRSVITELHGIHNVDVDERVGRATDEPLSIIGPSS